MERGEKKPLTATATGRAPGWPPLPYEAWKPTRDTLHMWTQIVGKIRLALAPPLPHHWHVTLYPTARGLTTSPMPHGERTVEIAFDFRSHELAIEVSDGAIVRLALASRPVATFYAEVMEAMRALEVPVTIRTLPVEVPDPIPFELDRVHGAYDPDAAESFFQVLSRAAAVLQRFGADFLGKASPVHFFWGSFDLASTRFSGRAAPPHPSVPYTPDSVVREAYSHEVASCGFWPGADYFPQAAFYAYAYPEPPGYRKTPISPGGAFYSEQLSEFLLPYDHVRASDDPDGDVLAFCHSTYDAAATLGLWDRPSLERPIPGARLEAAFPAPPP